MFLPLKLFHEIGGFDERFFLYGEDLDLCAKIKERGGSIWYTPETQIIHFKGKSSHQRSFRSGVAFYEAMILFSRKYRSSYGTFFPSWLIAIGVFIQALFGIGTRLARALTACFIDAVLINLVLWLGISIRFHFSTIGSPYQLGDIVSVFIMHILLSVSFLAVFVQRGVYTRERGTHKNTFYSGLFASVLFIVFVYFYQSLAYSRISLAVSSLMISGCLVAWRVVLPATVKGFKKLIYPTGNVLIMGDGDVAAYLIRNVEEDKTAHIVGVIWSGKAKKPADFSGYPVLGTMAGLKTVLERFNADLLLIATIEPWFAHVVEGLASTRVKNLTIQWVPSPILSEKIHDLPPVIPLNDFQNFTV